MLPALALVACALAAEPALAADDSLGPTNSSPPSISDTTPRPGQVLTGNVGSWSSPLVQPITYARRWLRCNAAGVNCLAIAGATGATYQVDAADIGGSLRLRVTATNVVPGLGARSNTRDSAATSVVPTDPPDNSGLPRFTGTAQVGKTLNRTSYGSWSNPTPTNYARGWLRCDPAGDNCVGITGETGDSYKLRREDAGRTIRLRVAAVHPYGFALADSAPSAVVKQSPAIKPDDGSGGPPTPEEKPKPTRLKPFPKVIVAGNLLGAGVVISRFVIRGEPGVKVKVRCRGVGCPYARRTIRMRKKRLRIRSLERSLLHGVRIEIRIVKKGRIGKYTRLRIRAGKAPKRIDRCIDPGVKEPRKC